MHVITKKFLSILFSSLCIISLAYGMHDDRYPWPIFPLLRDDNAASYTFNKFTIAIATRDYREVYDWRSGPSEMSPLQRLQRKLIEKDVENEKTQQFVVYNSRYARYVHQREKNVQKCIDCLHNSIEARLELPDLSYALDDENDLSDQLNAIFQEYLTELLSNFYLPDGQLKALVDYNAAAKSLGFYLMQFLSWEECLERVEGYVKEKVPGFAQFHGDMQSPVKTFKGIKNALEHLVRRHVPYPEFKKRIHDNAFNKDLLLLKDAYSNSDFKAAFDITEKYKLVQDKQKKSTQSMAVIDRSNIVVRFSRQLIPTLEPLQRIDAIQHRYATSAIVQHVGACAERSIRYNAVRGDQTATVEYLIQTLQNVSEKKRKQKKDTITQEFAQAHDAFFDEHGLPTIFSYDEKMVQSLPHMTNETDSNDKERMHLFKLAFLSKEKRYAENEQFRQALARAVNYFCHALQDKEHAHIYLLLSQALYNALTDENSYKTIGDFDFLPSEQLSATHEQLLHHIKTILQTKSEILTEEQRQFLNNSIDALSRVWVKARDEDNKEAQSYIQHSNPIKALAEENFLDVTADSERAGLTAQHVYEHSRAIGIDALLADNQGPISSSQLRAYETRISKLQNREYVPHLNTIMHIMHDAHTPKPIVCLLTDALEFWHTVRSREQREIAATVTDFAEVAYDYHKDGNESYAVIFLDMGRTLLKYAKITGIVALNNVQKGCTTVYSVVVTSPYAIEYALKTFQQATMPLVEVVHRLAHVLVGKSFYSPRDCFDALDLQELLENPTVPSRRVLEMHEKLDRFEQSITSCAQSASVVFSYIAYLMGIDASDLRAMNVETDKVVRAYINKLCAMSNEEKYACVADIVIDCLMWNKIFGLAGRLFGSLQNVFKHVTNVRKIQCCASEVKIIEEVAEAVVNGERVLVKATEKSLIPTIMKSEAEAIKASSKLYGLPQKVFKAHTTVMEGGIPKIVETTFSTEEALLILHNSRELKFLNRQIARLKKTVKDVRFGVSDRRGYSNIAYKKLESESEKFYKEIILNNSDVSKIAKNTGIHENIIQKIKNHVFIDDHILGYANDRFVAKFSADIDLYEAWKRLMEGNFVQSDLVLLQHELAESLLMQGIKFDYDTMHHSIVNIIYNWNDNLF